MQLNLQSEENERSAAAAAAAVSTATNATELSAPLQTADHNADVEALLARLQRVSTRHNWFVGIAAVLGVLCAAFIVMGLIVYPATVAITGHATKLLVDFSPTSFGISGTGGNGQSQMTVSGITPLLLLLGSGAFGALAKRDRVKLTRTLLQHEDRRAIGPLVEALFLRDKSVSTQAAAALTRLMPGLREEDAALLDSHRRLLLSTYLGRSRWSRLEDNDALSLAIIEAYWKIGDGTEVPAVTRLANSHGRAATSSTLREAATNYLAEIKRRASLAAEPLSLLRGSASEAPAASTLLRAAAGAGAAIPDSLLRASADPPPTKSE